MVVNGPPTTMLIPEIKVVFTPPSANIEEVGTAAGISKEMRSALVRKKRMRSRI